MILIMSYVCAETLRFECDYWEPYNAVPNSDEPGFQVEIAKRIFEDAGFTFEYKLVPFSRALRNVQSGTAHGTFGLYENEAKSNNLLIPKNHLSIGQTYFYVLNDDDWKYQGVASLKEKFLGVIQNYEYDDGPLDEYIALNKNTISVQVITGDNALERNILKLIHSRITVTLEDEIVMNWKLNKMNKKHLVKKAGVFNDSYKVYVAFTPTRPELIKIFDEGYEKIKNNGELQKILDKYNIP